MPNINEIRLSGTDYTIVDSTALHTLDNTVTSDGANAVKGSGIYAAITAVTEAIANMHYQTSGDVETAIAPLFGAVAYDSATQRINFYHDSTTGAVLTYVDATPFVKDGFLVSVDIEDVTLSGETVTCLVFKWNTDAGIQETDIPIADLFDPTNYYTKTEVDTALSGKQDTLTAGAGIAISNQNVISVTASTTVDTAMSDSSTNAVQNRVIKAYADTKNPMATVTGTTLILS